MAEDPFDDVLNLEEQFYQEGYKEGQADGIRAGRAEGRSLGLEKGFLKFVESGTLYGRAIVWANQLPRTSGMGATEKAASKPAQDETKSRQLPPLPRNPRLEKHITTLYALVEAESLSTENTDEAVNDFDDRLKRAHGKAKIIEKMVGGGDRNRLQETASSGKPKTERTNSI
ncbi:DUF1715 domain-containing protein [Lasiosphaeria miniovina]|uniref:DUF1715 domain-containing protein n=1 Tax=Lasiosphaeria miniovina TaxID=1954250 RepID=A0AA40B3S9_9PEZI|nr:DUF1715 domain-containing protein [Lasiosphaeria miniovina]KAK0726992.1 DUF1715 domain-containing protein [Lasiosphaeria miniovina]